MPISTNIPKDWAEYPSTTDPLTALAVEDMERRLVAERADGLKLRIGRQWHTNFAHAGYDNTLFDIVGFTRGTDGGYSALTQTTAGSEASCFLKAGQHLRNFELRLRYRTTATPHVSSMVNLYGRYLDVDNFWRLQRGWQPAADGPLDLLARTSGSDSGGVVSVSAPSDFTTTTSRILRIRVVDDVAQYKDYVEGSGLEPDWQFTRRVRGTDNATDNVELGIAGFTMNAAAAGSLFVAYDFTVTELLRIDPTLIYNGSALLRDDATGNPIWWFAPTQDVGNTVSIVSGTDPWGKTRDLFQCDQTATATESVQWKQNLSSATHFGPNVLGTRRRRTPASVFGPKAELSVWTKGTDITRPGGGSIFAAGFVFYYNDADGNGLNIGDPEYFKPFGPNASGEGTWDWTLNRYLIPLNLWQRIHNGIASVGFHDQSLGTLQFTDLTFRVVP